MSGYRHSVSVFACGQGPGYLPGVLFGHPSCDELQRRNSIGKFGVALLNYCSRAITDPLQRFHVLLGGSFGIFSLADGDGKRVERFLGM